MWGEIIGQRQAANGKISGKYYFSMEFCLFLACYAPGVGRIIAR
jgi:hypothetical protein